MSQRVGSIKKLLSSARAMRWGMNIWPPFLFTGVRIAHISPDFRVARIKLAKTPFTTNYFGTQFGGTMFSMVDPFWAFMLFRNLGPNYVVWDRRGEIDFESPGHTSLYAQIVLTEEIITELRERADAGERVLHWFEVDLLDRSGGVVAKARKQVYVRRKR